MVISVVMQQIYNVKNNVKKSCYQKQKKEVMSEDLLKNFHLLYNMLIQAKQKHML